MASKQCLPPIIHILARQRAAQAAGPAVVASVTETVCPAQANFMAHLRAPIARMRTPQETPMPRPARTRALPRPSVLLAATLLPFLTGMSGWFYLVSAVALGLGFCGYAFRLWRGYSEALARRTFWFSIWHLSLLFAALLIDHYIA